MEKLDLKKNLKHLYSPSKDKVMEVDVPAMYYLMIDGQGNPNASKSFQDAVEVLYALSYTIKFTIKKSAQAVDYGVMPLEGLWWSDDMSSFLKNDKSNWKWTLMIMQPSFVSPKIVNSARAELKEKKDLPALQKVRFEALTEGRCAQILHIGPFSEEGPTIEKVHRFISERGHKLRGKHHEIYLSDIRKAAPEKWKTVIRQPMD